MSVSDKDEAMIVEAVVSQLMMLSALTCSRISL